jgi:hypothetical protein
MNNRKSEKNYYNIYVEIKDNRNRVLLRKNISDEDDIELTKLFEWNEM